MAVPTYEVWDLVHCVGVPNQENPTQATARPVIIYEDLVETAIIIPLTKNINQEKKYNYTLRIEKDSEDGKILHLKNTSILALDRIVKISKYLLVRKIGKCSEDLIEDIEALIKKAENEGFTRLKEL